MSLQPICENLLDQTRHAPVVGVEATQALAEMIQDKYLKSDHRNAALSALIDAIQERTSHALTQSQKGVADIEAVFAAFREKAGIKDETRSGGEL